MSFKIIFTLQKVLSQTSGLLEAKFPLKSRRFFQSFKKVKNIYKLHIFRPFWENLLNVFLHIHVKGVTKVRGLFDRVKEFSRKLKRRKILTIFATFFLAKTTRKAFMTKSSVFSFSGANKHEQMFFWTLFCTFLQRQPSNKFTRCTLKNGVTLFRTVNLTVFPKPPLQEFPII